jgi:HEAT repeat protein
VRAAAVRALGRLNSPKGQAVLAAAFEDKDVSVRRAAIDQVLRLNAWQDGDVLVARLADGDAQVRVRAAQISGEHGLTAAVPQLATIVASDDSAPARQAAAWALGRIGGGDAKQALTDARQHEHDPGVLDALDVALRM